MIKLTIQHNLTVGLDALGATEAQLKDKRAINKTVEVAASKAIKEHLTANYAGRLNALGGTSTGYWRRAIDNTTSVSDDAGATISINQTGVRLKYTGGVIRATGRASEVTGKPTKFLSIPVHPSAHGRTIADLGGKSAFYIVPFANGGAGVFRKTGGKSTNNDPLYYILKSQVTIKADKGILPSDTQISDAITSALRHYFSAPDS